MDPSHISILFLLVVSISVGDLASEPEPLVSNDSFFNLKSKDKVQYGDHRRVKRADVSQIKHLYDERRISWHTQQQKDAILAKHLDYRSSTNPEASNMEYMTWNEQLAELAGLWASVCFWGHGMTNHTDLKNNFDSIGQNLWLGGGKPNGVGSVVSWHDNEVNNYIYEDAECKPRKVCGHYTQVVWANSKEVGCARAFCSKLIDNEGGLDGRTNLWIEACHYAPGGNYVGVRPFKSGPSCTQCASGIGCCLDNACTNPPPNQVDSCDCRQICHNCGSVTGCKCTCLVGWHGTACTKRCEDTHENCWKSPGWPSPAYCGQHPAIPAGCPAMCGLCVPGDEECVTTEAPVVTTTITTETPSVTTTITTEAHIVTSTITTETPVVTTTFTTETPDVTTTMQSTVSTTSSTSQSTTATSTGCKKTCENKGILQKNCKCKCPDDYAGTSCEKLVEEVVHGTEVLFAEHISHYTEEFEITLRQTVASLTTIYCNDNLQDCCEGENSDINRSNNNGLFDFVSYNEVVIGQGYPVIHPNLNAFWTLIVIKVNETTELCDSRSLSANRRRRDLKPNMNRNRRAGGDTLFLDQDVLLKVIKDNKNVIEDELNVTIDDVRRGVVAKTPPLKRINSGDVAAGVVVTLLVIIIVVFIVVFVKRRKERHHKADFGDKTKDVPVLVAVRPSLTDEDALQKPPLNGLSYQEKVHMNTITEKDHC